MVKSINDSLKAGKEVSNIPMGLMTLFRPSVQPYLISWYRYNPQEVIAKLRQPVLILQGDKECTGVGGGCQTVETIFTEGTIPDF